MVQILPFFHYQWFCSFSNPSSINDHVLYTAHSVSVRMTAIGDLGIFKFRIENRISFIVGIVGIANQFVLEKNCSSVRES